MLSDLDVTEEDAVKWGKLLQEAVHNANSSVSAYPDLAIEEY